MTDYFDDWFVVPEEDGSGTPAEAEWEELFETHRRALFRASGCWTREDEEVYTPSYTPSMATLDDFDFSNETNFERGDFGKLIVYLDVDERRVVLATSKQIQGLTLIDSGLPSLRRYLTDTPWITTQVGYHKDISMGQNSVVLGGASYFAFDFDTVFVDGESGDFGQVSLGLVERCLPGVEIITLQDRKYFARASPEEILQRAMD